MLTRACRQPGWWCIVKAELAPFDGRLAIAARTAAICALTAMTFMIYGIPMAAIACYLVLFVMKPNTSASMLMSIGILILVGVLIFIILNLTRVSIERPLLRMALLALSSYALLYLAAASKLGPAGSIVALVIAFILTLIGDVPFGEVATRAILYAWLMATIPLVILLAVLAVLGPSPSLAARRAIAGRLRLAGGALTGAASPQAVRAVLHEGNGELEKTLLCIRLFHLLPGAESARLSQAVGCSYSLLAATAALAATGGNNPGPEQERIAHACQWLAEATEAGRPLDLPPDLRASLTSPPSSPAYGALREHLLAFPRIPGGNDPDIKPMREGFFLDDARTNPSYSQFALKTTFCAILCYVIYTALQWQDIHTAMITCYVAALGTVGETVHKLMLRIIGCLIGAAMGAAAILFLMPHLTSIGHLMLLIFAGTLVASWVSMGSEKSAYAGLQIGLAFLLTVLQGFGPEVKLSVAMDRVVGILLGNLVLYLVFTRVWPVSAARTTADQLDKLSQRLAALRERPSASLQARMDIPIVLPRLARLQEQLGLASLEPPSLNAGGAQLPALKQAAANLENRYLLTAFTRDPAPKARPISAVAPREHLTAGNPG